MPLDPLAFLAGTNPFLSNWCNQVVSLITGKMVDQPVTLADGLTVIGGINSSGGSSFSGALTVTSNSSHALAVGANGVTNPSFRVNAVSSGAGVEVVGGLDTGTVFLRAIAPTNANLNLDAAGGQIYIANGNSSTVFVQQKLDAQAGFTSSTGSSFMGGVSISSGGASVFGGVALSSGNLSFGDLAQRITGDFSNGTQSNRVLFQTTTVGGATNVGIIPSSSGTTGQVTVFGSADPTNSPQLAIQANETLTATVINTAHTGTASTRPLLFQKDGVTQMTMPTAGGFQVNIGGFTVSSGGSSIVGGLAVSTGGVQAQATTPSSAFVKAFSMGSSGPFIGFCASTPTVACVVGSLAMNVNGSSTTNLYVCTPNSGGASSSNWDTFTLI